MIPVTSSNLSAVGYNASTYSLYIKFHDGSTYEYSGVPENIYSGLMSAGSKGSYANDFIYRRYSQRKV